MLALLLIFALILGLWLIVRGWAGRRVGDAPCCSRCNFDLTGIYPILDKCPECGAALAADGSVATGRFERRWRQPVIGLVLVLFAGTSILLRTNGILSTGYLVQNLSTAALTEWSLRRPRSPIAREGRWELEMRIRGGALSATDEDGVLDALLEAIEPPEVFNDDSIDRLLQALIEFGRPTVQQDIAQFLVERHSDDTRPWDAAWGVFLGTLRGQGAVSDEAWDACLTRAFTPQPWIPGDRPIRPGEEFVLTLRPSSRPISSSEHRRVEFDLPAGVMVIERIGYAWDDEVWLGSGGWDEPVLLLRAPAVEGEFEITAHWTANPVPPQAVPRSSRPRTQTLSLTGRSGLVVRAEEPSTDETAGLGRWLSLHLVPSPRREGGYAHNVGFFFTTGMTVVMKGAEFFAKGKLVLVGTNGAEEQLCRFSVSDSGSHNSFSVNSAHGSSSSSGTGGSEPPTFELWYPESALHAAKGTRLIIRFEAVTLPDGRTHTGPDPIEIELPPEALVPALR